MKKLHFTDDALQFTRNNLRGLIHIVEIGETKSLSNSFPAIERFLEHVIYILFNVGEYELLRKVSNPIKPLSRRTSRQKALSILRDLSKELEKYQPLQTLERVAAVERTIALLKENVRDEIKNLLQRVAYLFNALEEDKLLHLTDRVAGIAQRLNELELQAEVNDLNIRGLLEREHQGNLKKEEKTVFQHFQHMVGEIKVFAGWSPPDNWAFCHGQELNIRERRDLFEFIGTTYGGDGLITFALPDLRGRVPVGARERDENSYHYLGAPDADVRIALSEGNDNNNNQLSYLDLNYIICLENSNPERDD
jgi:microcystin-dependent protein